MKKYLLKSIIAVTIMYLPLIAHAQLHTSQLFSNGMVLQRGVELPVWGTGTAGLTIDISFNGESGSTTVDGEGKWKVMLPSMTAGGPFEMIITDGTNTKTVSDVYIGDVWLCSGQSNMEMTVNQANNSASTIAAANSQTIRECKVSKGISEELSDELPATSWKPATSANVGNFTATGYYFANDLQAEIGDIPIGLLNISYGGSRIEAWMSEEILGYDEKDVTLGGGEDERQPTLIFNKMFNPVIGYPVKGFLWYQGESNADSKDDALAYGNLFKTMITYWRELWDMGDLPFIWAQLPNFYEAASEDAPSTFDIWPVMRASQSRALSLPNTGEGILIDVGEYDIHPLDKESVGERLALVTRHVAYSEDIVYNGPRYSGHRILADGSVKIGFDHVGGGLVAKDVVDGALKWFSCAGDDEVLHKADAIIDGDSVIVSCSAVTSMEIIRYAWEYNPDSVNFYNAEDLPAAPFLIKVQPQTFDIVDFSTNDTLIERGQTVFLQWETSEASFTAINGVEKDYIGAAYLMPLDTIVYELVTVNINDNADTLRSSIVVNVMDPLPIITLYTEYGNVYPLNEEIKLLADAVAPAGGTIVSVDFYIDDVLLFSDDTAPYEKTWTPDALATYQVKAVATNEKGATKESLLIIYVNDLDRARYEAENATLTGDATVKSNSSASESKCVDVQSNWTLTFNIEVPEDGDYQGIIRYLLNYESPKEQVLTVNDANLGNVRFETEDITQWVDYGITLSLIKGVNTISLSPSWGWMSFDYIDVLGATPQVIDGGTAIRTENMKKGLNLDISELYKNNVVYYTIPEMGNVTISLYTAVGHKVFSVEQVSRNEGTHSAQLNLNDLNSGMYILSMVHNQQILTKKVLVK